MNSTCSYWVFYLTRFQAALFAVGHGEDIEVMRIVLRDEMTTELMVEALTGITQAVESLIDQAYVR